MRGTKKQEIARKLNWSKATIVGCCAQLKNQMHFVCHPAAIKDFEEFERTMLKCLQTIATAQGIKGDYTKVLHWEETRFMKRFNRISKELDDKSPTP